MLQLVLLGAAMLFAAPFAAMFVYNTVINPGVIEELRADPQGERAQTVMLLTLPSGRMLPVNYLEEDGRVYAGADGRWWTELRDGHEDVTVWIRGGTMEARARTVIDDPDYTKDVFSRLRPDAIPGFGRLVEILLDPDDAGGPIARSAR